MKININNYEAYFLDFIEGKLDPQAIAELEAFLALHPELNKKLEYFDQVIFAKAPLIYPDKELIKKFQFDTAQINNNNFNDFCIAWFEHLLNNEKAKELFDYLSINPERNKDFNCFEKAYLKPQAKILFSDKSGLYQKVAQNPIIPTIGIRWLSIAASIAILITVYLKFMVQPNIQLNRQLTSSAFTDQSIKPKSSENLKLINPKYSKEEKNSSYNNLNSNDLEKINIIDTLSKNKLGTFIDSLKRTNQIAFIKSHETTIIEINNEADLKNTLNKYIVLTDNLYKTRSASYKPNSFERLTKIKMDNLKNKDGQLSFIKLVQVAINGINQLTNSNMKLTQKTDTLGNIIALSFESGAFEYHRVKGN